MSKLSTRLSCLLLSLALLVSLAPVSAAQIQEDPLGPSTSEGGEATITPTEDAPPAGEDGSGGGSAGLLPDGESAPDNNADADVGGDDLPDADADAGEDGLPDADADAGEDGLPDADAGAGEDDLPDADADAGEDDLPNADAGAGEDGLPDADADNGEDGLPDADADAGEDDLPDADADDGEDGLPAPLADAAPPTIEGYTRITSMEQLTDHVYLIVAAYNGGYYLLYPGATGTGQNADNVRKLQIDSDGKVTGCLKTDGTTDDSFDFAAADNTITKGDGTYSVTAAAADGNGTYYLFNGTSPVYNAASPSTVTIEASAKVTGAFRLCNSSKSYLIYYSTHGNFNQGGSPDSHTDTYFPDMFLYRVEGVSKTGLNAVIAEAEGFTDGSIYTPATWAALEDALNEAQTIADKDDATQAQVLAAAKALRGAIDALELCSPVIPGYNLVTEIPAGGLDITKYYIIVSQDSAGKPYVLVPKSTSAGPGSLVAAGQPANYAAALTISGTDVTATMVGGSAGDTVDMENMRFALEESGDGYLLSVNSREWYLTMGSSMFTADPAAVNMAISNGILTVTGNNRVLDFNKQGDPKEYVSSNYKYGTDFWAPDTARFPLYLYEVDGINVLTAREDLELVVRETDEGYNAADFTTATWATLQSAMDKAKQLLDSGPEDKNAAEYRTALSDLWAAVHTLQKAPAVLNPSDSTTAYVLDTDGIDAGKTYLIMYSEGSLRKILYHASGTATTDQVDNNYIDGDRATLNKSYKDEYQLWTTAEASGGGYALASVSGGHYLNINGPTAAASKVPVTSEQQGLTIHAVDGASGGYTISREVGGTTYYVHHDNDTTQFYVSETPTTLYFYEPVQRDPKVSDWHTLVPPSGTTIDAPFPAGTGGSSNFRIPSMITLSDGTIVAAIDARWNITGDACSLDTLVSISKDNGATWEHSFVNYFGDSIDVAYSYGTAFIDPVMVRDANDKIYLMVDLFPGGVALNTAPMRPATASGYVDIGGGQHLVLYTTGNASEQTDSNYSYYIGDFSGGYATVFNALDHSDSGFYVDEHYYLYRRKGDSRDTEADKIYCDRLGDLDTWVQQNVFFHRASLHVRCATYLWLVTSEDGGRTWSTPTILNPQVRGNFNVNQFYGVGPGAGLCLTDGTIILPCYTFTAGAANGSAQIASFIYSNDAGRTWHRSEDATKNTDEVTHWSSESCLVQIDATTVRHFYRDGYATLWYTDHTWNGSSWTAGEPVDTGVSKTYNNQLSAIRYSSLIDGKPAIIVSTADGGQNARKNGKLYTFLLNDDKTMTMAYEYVVDSGVYGYSSLTELPDGSISILYEGESSKSIYVNIPSATFAPGGVISAYPPANSGSSTTVTTQPTKPAPSKDTSVTVETEATETGVSAVMDSKAANTLVRQAINNKSENVTVKVDAPASAAEAALSLPASAVADLASKTNADLTVETPVADITISNRGLSGMGGGAQTITVTAAKDGDSVTLTVAKDGTPVSKITGGIKADIPVSNAAPGTVAILVNEDGSETVIKKAMAVDGSINLDLEGSATLKIVDNSKSFTDTDGHWASDSIDFATSRDLFYGVSSDTFAADMVMSRAMLVTVLHRLEDTPAGGTASFPDVTGDTWYGDAVAWAADKGIVAGTGSGFDPNGPVTREQIATFLYRYAKATGTDTSASGQISGFGDGADVSSWAAEAMSWAVGAGIIQGKGDSQLDPSGQATRGEVATMLMRFVAYIN